MYDNDNGDISTDSAEDADFVINDGRDDDDDDDDDDNDNGSVNTARPGRKIKPNYTPKRVEEVLTSEQIDAIYNGTAHTDDTCIVLVICVFYTFTAFQNDKLTIHCNQSILLIFVNFVNVR